MQLNFLSSFMALGFWSYLKKVFCCKIINNILPCCLSLLFMFPFCICIFDHLEFILLYGVRQGTTFYFVFYLVTELTPKHLLNDPHFPRRFKIPLLTYTQFLQAFACLLFFLPPSSFLSSFLIYL